MTGKAYIWSESSSDAELITAARGGDSAAFGTLYERHSAAASAVARQYTRSTADAEDVAADAFARVFAVVRAGGGPDIAFRAYLFTVVRRLAYAGAQRGHRVEPTDDVSVFETAFGAQGTVEDPALAGFERGVVAKAYSSLPERWQAALWYTEVEGLSAAQIGPLLGLSANGVAALSYRAREGLRQAYLQQHLATPLNDGCRRVNDKLGSYVRGGLARRETAQVDAHLEGCDACRTLVLELGDVNHGMRMVIAPLVLGVAGLGALAQSLPVGGLGIGAGVAVGAGGASGAGLGVAGGSAGAATAGTAAGTAVGTGAAAGTAVGAAAAAGTAVGTGAAAGTAVGVGAAAGTAVVTGVGAAAGTAVGTGVGAAVGTGLGVGSGVAAGAGAFATAGASAGASGSIGAVAGALAAGATHAAGLASIGAAGAGVAAGAAATTGGVAALVASIPASVAGAMVAGLVGASLAVAGGTGSVTAVGPSQPVAAPTATLSTVPAPPRTAPAASAGTGPADLPVVVGPPVPVGPSSTTAVDQTVPAAPAPSIGPGTSPADTNSVPTPALPGLVTPVPAPKASPSPAATQPPATLTPANLVASYAGRLALTPGALASLSFDIANAGQASAKNLRVELSVPGVRYGPPIEPQPVPVGQGRAANQAAAKVATWVCAAGTGAVSAICTAPELAGLSTSTLTVRMRIAKRPVAPEAASISLNVVSDSTAPVRLVVALPPAASRATVGPLADPGTLAGGVTLAGAELAIEALAKLAGVSAGVTPCPGDADVARTASRQRGASTSLEPVEAGSPAAGPAAAGPAAAGSPAAGSPAAGPAAAMPPDPGPVPGASPDLASATGASPDGLSIGAGPVCTVPEPAG